jgi:probable HAF family extracellular repeat protein
MRAAARFHLEGMGNMRNKTKMTILAAGVAWLGLAVPAAAAPSYQFTDLGFLAGGDSASGQATANGHVAGYAGTSTTSAAPREAFIWQNGALASLGTLGGTRSTGLGVNDQGDVVGWARDGSEATRAMLYSNGAMTDLNTAHGTPGWNLSYAWDINSSGQIVGVGTGAGGDRGYLLSGGQLFDLGTLGGSRSDAYGINEAGDVVGRARTASEQTHAFLYSNGFMVDLGTLGGASSQAWDINDAGQIAGWATDANGDRMAFLYENGTMFALADAGGGFNQAYGINDAGEVAGQARNAAGDSVAALWIGDAAFDLNDLVVGAAGWTFDFAWDINDQGWIVGNATDAQGNLHAFLLTPVPEPGTLVVFGGGLLALFLVGSRRQALARAAA